MLAVIATAFGAAVQLAAAAPAPLTLNPSSGYPTDKFTANTYVVCPVGAGPPPPINEYFYWDGITLAIRQPVACDANTAPPSYHASFIFSPPAGANKVGVHQVRFDWIDALGKTNSYTTQYTIVPVPTPTPTPTATPPPTPVPTRTPTPRPTATPITAATATPTPAPTETPTPEPSPSPSETASPSPSPTVAAGAPTPSIPPKSTPSLLVGLLTPTNLVVGALCLLIPLALIWAAFTMFGGAGAAGAAAGPSVMASGGSPPTQPIPPPSVDPPVDGPS
jgi:hypothetical protein